MSWHPRITKEAENHLDKDCRGAGISNPQKPRVHPVGSQGAPGTPTAVQAHGAQGSPVSSCLLALSWVRKHTGLAEEGRQEEGLCVTGPWRQWWGLCWRGGSHSGVDRGHGDGGEPTKPPVCSLDTAQRQAGSLEALRAKDPERPLLPALQPIQESLWKDALRLGVRQFF